MSSPVDLDRRLRTAAGSEPDTERALDDVMHRIFRPARRRTGLAAVTALCFVLAVSTWLVSRSSSDDSSVVVGVPPDKVDSAPGDNSVALAELWTAQGVGMGGSFVPSGGRLTVSTGDEVFVAEGFGSGEAEPSGRINALDRRTGRERWAVELGGPAFLQGATSGTVIASTQHERIVALNVADGTLQWEIALSTLGLEGYGAVTSAISDSLSAIGVSANDEGDVRPPVLLGVDTATGELRWSRSLVHGTDLSWGPPPVSEGQAVVTSTLSHPRSAEENVAHLIDLAQGSILWTVGLGGSQSFSKHPAIINGDYVHLPAHPEVLTVDLADGARRWSRPGLGAVLSDAGLWMFAADQSLELVDPATGGVVREVETPTAAPSQLLDLRDGFLGVASRMEFAVIDRDGRVQLRHRWPHVLVDVVLFERGELFVATSNASIVAYSIEAAVRTPEG